MDQALLRFYYVRPELLRNSELPGIERAAIALEIQCIFSRHKNRRLANKMYRVPRKGGKRQKPCFYYGIL